MTPALPTVVVIDDDPDYLNLLNRVFTGKGFACHALSNGADALAVLRRLPSPCVVVCDQEMPAMKGLDVLQRARALAAGPIRFILISGDADASLRQRAATLGAEVVMEKPLDLKKLVDRVHRPTAS